MAFDSPSRYQYLSDFPSQNVLFRIRWRKRALREHLASSVFLFPPTKCVAYVFSIVSCPDFENRRSVFLPLPHDLYPVQLGLSPPLREFFLVARMMKLILLRLTLITLSISSISSGRSHRKIPLCLPSRESQVASAVARIRSMPDLLLPSSS